MQWLSSVVTLAKKIVYHTGGQNVNKVNTKATLRVEMDKAKEWMPPHIQEAMRETVRSCRRWDEVI